MLSSEPGITQFLLVSIMPHSRLALTFASIPFFTCFVAVTTLARAEEADSPSRSASNFDLQVVSEFSLEDEIGLLRAMPVWLGENERALLLAYSRDKDIDPYIEMFYAPTDRMKFVVCTMDGDVIWKNELRPCVINGIWFCPIFPFDLNQDGVDEIYYVTNIDDVHLLAYSKLRLAAADPRNGEELGLWKWNPHERSTLSRTFRNFIMGGYVRGEPVLLTGQGTYGRMSVQAWNPGMQQRWKVDIEDDGRGARGSHQSPVVDYNADGVDELFWGERCIEIDRGRTLFIGDEKNYNGHSDVIQPTYHWGENKWYLFTARESGEDGSIQPRVVMFDSEGDRVWSDLEQGHMDMGYTTQTSLDGDAIAFTISRGDKRAGPEGFFRLDVKEFAYDAFTGKRIELPFVAYNTIPVDLNGDGLHEFARSFGEQADRLVVDRAGKTIGSLGDGAYLAMASKFMDLPGEQILCYHADGTIRIWADKNAEDRPRAKARYAHPFYKINQRMTGNGYNTPTLGGL